MKKLYKEEKKMTVGKKITAGIYDSERYGAENDPWYEKQAKMNKVFRLDLEAEFEVANHPKSEKLWELAWTYGHSEGLYEIYYFYGELVELIKPERD